MYKRQVWCLVIGALIIVWILIGITNLGKVNTVAMAALFILTLILFKIIFFDGTVVASITDETFSFGAAVELAVAMPLSWLPLISDYTREAKEPVKAKMCIRDRLKKAPSGGNRDARIRIKAPIRIVNRLITPVIVTSPTFWLKEVSGRHPKHPEIVLENPSTARDPCSSSILMSRSKDCLLYTSRCV